MRESGRNCERKRGRLAAVAKESLLILPSSSTPLKRPYSLLFADRLDRGDCGKG